MNDRGTRKTGRAYRRVMTRKHNADLMRIISRGYKPWAGYVDYAWVDGELVQVGTYIKYLKNSDSQQYWKRHSNKLIRRRGEIFQGNQYRKCFDYQWMRD